MSKDDAKKYLKVRPKYDGGPWAVILPNELPDLVGDDPREEYEIVEQYIRPSVVEAMREFDGW